MFGNIGNQIHRTCVGQIEFRLFWIDELVMISEVDEEGRESAMQQSSCLDYSGVQHLLYIHLLLVILKQQLSMGFSFAVLLSIVNKKRRKPRLQEFRDKLQKKKITNVTLYQYPSKTLFFITVIILMGMCFEWFIVQLKSDIEMQQSLMKPKENFTQVQNSDMGIERSESRNYNKKSKTIDVEAMSRVRITINIIHFFEVCSIAALLSSLKLRVVKTNKGDKFIQAINYLDLGLQKQREQYQIKEGDTLQIWELGQTRFTNTNYYYSIRIVNQSQNWEIIRKSHIFGARTAVIQLGFVHKLPYSTKIKKIANPEVKQHKDQ